MWALNFQSWKSGCYKFVTKLNAFLYWCFWFQLQCSFLTFSRKYVRSWLVQHACLLASSVNIIWYIPLIRPTSSWLGHLATLSLRKVQERFRISVKAILPRQKEDYFLACRMAFVHNRLVKTFVAFAVILGPCNGQSPISGTCKYCRIHTIQCARVVLGESNMVYRKRVVGTLYTINFFSCLYIFIINALHISYSVRYWSCDLP